MYKIKRYFQGVWKQAKMVRWPKRKELAQAVSVVLVVVAFAAICMLVSDLIISNILKDLDKSFPTDTDTETSSEALNALKTLFIYMKGK